MSSIIDTSNRVPRAYVRVSLGVGRRTTGGSARKILLVGNKTSAGSMLDETPEQVFSEDEVIAKAGDGSELHRMYLKTIAANRTAQITLVAVTESAGANATATITFVGTATKNDTFILHVGDRKWSVPVYTGDAIADIAGRVVDAINGVYGANTKGLPFTASVSGGVVTLTAKQKGPRGNELCMKYKFEEGSNGFTGPIESPHEYFTGGTTSDDPTNALMAVEPERFHLIVSPYSDATNNALFKAHVDEQSEALQGHRCRFVFGSQASLGILTAITMTLNAERGQVAWHYMSHQTCAEIAASLAGTLAKGLASDPAYNFDGEVLAGIEPQWVVADRPLNSELVSALIMGITPVGIAGTDATIVRSTTTKWKNAAGTASDLSVSETHYVDVADFIADELEAAWPVDFKGFKIGKDIEGEVPPPGVATPRTMRNWAASILARYSNTLLVNVDQTIEEMTFEENADVPGRIDAVIPIDVIELFHQFGADVRQIG